MTEYKKVCSICGSEFISNHPRKKRCSEKCAQKHWRQYMRERSRNKYRNDKDFRKKHKESHKKSMKKHRKKRNAYARYQRKWRGNKREGILKLLSKNTLIFLQKLAKEQQVFVYIRKSKCEVPDCEITKNLILHEVKYSPIKTVTLCAKHHSILHHCLLRRKKVKKRINLD